MNVVANEISHTGHTCIYCSGPGPFSDEHVIPAGLGGDDNRFLLKDMVCAICNTERFSPLEAEFLRNSPVSIARVHLQKEGRKRGSKVNTPKFTATEMYLIDEEGRRLFIDYGEGGKTIILPQLIMIGEKQVEHHGPDQEATQSFFDVCKDLLGESLICAHKGIENGNEVTISVAYDWENDSYIERDRDVTPKVRGKYLWLSIDASNNENGDSQTRLFQRKNGQLVLTTSTHENTIDALNFFRRAAQQISTDSSKESVINNPLVKVSASFSIYLAPRVFAKIAFNILAFLLPRDYVALPQFEKIKRTILTGEPKAPIYPDELHKPLQEILALLTPKDHHSFYIGCGPSPSGGLGLFVMANLYGSYFQFVLLGDSLPPPAIDLPVLFTVAYNEHRITMYSQEQFTMLNPMLVP